MDTILGVIGCGNMGGAIVRGMVAENVISRGDIFLYDKDIDKAKALAEETGCSSADLSRTMEEAGILLIAVKPQDAQGLFSDMAGDTADKEIISIMAGVRISVINESLGGDVAVARAMPNMGAFIGESITCVCCNERFGKKAELLDIFKGIGKVAEVDEDAMDAVTAVSGSGPAYVFYLAEAIMEAAINEGLDAGVADTLVRQTIKGAGLLLEGAEETPAELVSRVASKGGTTEAALNVFNEEDMGRVIAKAVAAARKRSEELSRGM